MDDTDGISWKDRRRELHFPSPERIQVGEALAWMEASLDFFEKACRSEDLTRLMACGKIAYALHNLPELVVKRLRDEPVTIVVYGPGFAMEGPPEVTRYCGAFFSLPTFVQIPAQEISADDPIFQELSRFYLLFRIWNIGHAQTSYDEALDTLKRHDLSEDIRLCRKRVKAMRSHFDLWVQQAKGKLRGCDRAGAAPWCSVVRTAAYWSAYYRRERLGARAHRADRDAGRTRG